MLQLQRYHDPAMGYSIRFGNSLLQVCQCIAGEDNNERKGDKCWVSSVCAAISGQVDTLSDGYLKLLEPCVLVNVATLELDFAVNNVEETTTLQCETLPVWRITAKLT